MDINKLVEKFLAWPLPDSVCSDLCATKQGYPHRSGTTLLSAVEAKQMLEYLLADIQPPMTWTTDKPTKPGFYWWKDRQNAQTLVFVRPDDIVEIMTVIETPTYRWIDHHNVVLSQMTGEWQGPIEPSED